MKRIQIVFILIILSTSAVFAQKTVTGVVKDVNGLPIPGTNIVIKGSTVGTITDVEGSYKLNNIKSSDILQFSFIGFENVEIKVGNQSSIDVVLKTSEIMLEDVVAVGYDVVRKRDLTGAVAKVNTDDIAKTATTNFDQALAGRVSGVQVTSTDGTPGEGLNIVIRGGNSITGDNSPLYVVDGFPMEDFDPASISTRDIKNFDILKDASATAIYGARGANGVIVITTHGGRSDGSVEVKMHSSLGVQYIPNRMEVMSPYEYVKYQKNIAYANDNYSPGEYIRIFETNWLDPKNYENVKGTNWQDEIFRAAVVQDYNFSIGGGSQNSSIYYSGSYLKQDGTLITTGFEKFNNRLKFNQKIADNLQFTGQISYDHYIRSGLQVSGNTASSVIRDAVTFRPVDPINWSGDDEEYAIDQDPYLYNPVKTLNNTDRKRADDVIGGYLALNYSFWEKFTLDVKGSYWRNIREESIFYRADTQQASRTDKGIHGNIANRRYTTLATSNTLRYKDKIGKSSFGALIGVEAQHRTFKISSLENTNLPTDVFGIDNIGIATGSTIAISGKSGSTLLSYFGRVNYNYNERYLLTLNLRTDGSSKFQKANRWGYFPSFSAAWRIKEEAFLKSVDVISNLKIRAGYGLTGNNRIGDFDAYNLLAVGTTSGYVLGPNQDYSPGAYQRNMAVPDLRWETTAQTNLGVDFGFFDQLVNGTVDLYHKRTKDLLLDAEMAPSSGFNRVQQNVGEVENKGIEISLNNTIIKRSKFKWSTDFNISFNRTKTVKLNSGQQEILIDPRWDTQFMQSEYQYVTRVGHTVGMMYGLEFDGLYQLEDFIVTSGSGYQLKDGVPTYRSQMQPGMAKFKDQLTVDTNGDGIADAGDGVIDEKDRVIIGNPHPKHFGGFTNNISYKGFDLQVLFQWAYDFDILNGNKAEFGGFYKNTRNGLSELANIWTPTNTDTDVSGIRYNGVNLTTPYGYKLDDRFIDDGSYLKLKTVVLGYNLSRKVLKKFNVDRCRLSVSAQNLYTWTKYKGYNPDVSVGRYGALTPGLDYSAYPQSIAITGGIDIVF
ncbi:TonB-linked outer membrane protein, SusC/RagA family [Mariniphaga anaerophila]|uniref:TonB-linked outer membrane protein, SusC/RagA family n=1 Tax=Mariniphaga anaerophila TaxID=1484053 RepID=A0A1M5CPY8_9BACT|nr:TonB-dependent receptor [Mariniphaga anaerophila]SHF56482.1 TonB-linked outer membrane protein, SusC/RagA family [Mariniphaga anaerophila]